MSKTLSCLRVCLLILFIYLNYDQNLEACDTFYPKILPS